MKQLAEVLAFVIDPPGTDCRCIHWTDGGIRPASAAEIAMWDALVTRALPHADPSAAKEQP